jgi:hypothetical protein
MSAPSMVGSLLVPVVSKFGDRDPIGYLCIRREDLPLTPNFHFAIGYQVKARDASSGIVTEYELMEVAIVPDALMAAVPA